MTYKDDFKNLSENILHGNSDYFSHCFSVHDILLSIGADVEICKAGLYHSIYGSDNFQTENNISREIIVESIGPIAENLVFKFCNIRNRFDCILNNSFKFNPYEDKALTQIEYANLKEQYQRSNDSKLLEMCEMLMHKLSLYNLDFEQYIVNNKELYIFDNIFESADIEHLNQYCLNSLYRPEHSSNDMNYEKDSRFVALMSPDELKNSKILSGVKKVCTSLKQDLFIGYQYINHYALNTSVSAHSDSSDSGQYTILIFPNKYWEDTWGGEIAFFETGNVHKLIKFVPGRVIVFDSRILHQVLPITRNARKDRYSIALKCCNELGLNDFKKIYDIHTKVEKDEL